MCPPISPFKTGNCCIRIDNCEISRRYTPIWDKALIELLIIAYSDMNVYFLQNFFTHNHTVRLNRKKPFHV